MSRIIIVAKTHDNVVDIHEYVQDFKDHLRWNRHIRIGKISNAWNVPYGRSYLYENLCIPYRKPDQNYIRIRTNHIFEV